MLRRLIKNKLYTLINIGGLSLGLAASFFIFLYVRDELSFDRFHKDALNTYRISLTLKFGNLDVFVPMASAPLGAAMKDQIPEVTESIRLLGLDVNHVFKYDDKSFTEKKVIYADSNFFSFFSFKLLEGNSKTALKEPNTMVITPVLGRKYFGTENVLGKLISIDGEAFTVSGIVDQPPANSHITFDALISMQSNPVSLSHSWMGNRFLTYVKLIPEANPVVVHKKLDDLVLRNIGPDLENSLGISLQQFQQQKSKIGYDLHPMVDTHLYSKFPRDFIPAGDITYVYIFIAIGVALLLIACINFMNLSTAQFTNRVRAVSIQKVLGASRSQLVRSLVQESIILCFVGACISVITLYFLLPFTNSVSGKSIDSFNILSPSSISAMLLMATIAGVVSASYPSFYLTSFNPIDSLRGKTRSNPMSEYIRKGLVIFQYSVSIGVIAFTVVLFNQLDFINNYNLGFKKNGIVALRNIDRLGDNAIPLKNALLSETGVTAASFTDRTIFERMSGEAVRVPNTSQSHIMNFYVSDEDQLKVLGCKLIHGRFFSKDFLSDSNAVVINEAAMRDLGWTDVESKELAADADTRYKVVGVINNFNYESLRSEIKPLLIFYNPLPGNTLNIRFDGNPKQLIGILENNWKQFGNGEPFDYSFLDSDFDALFKSESRIGKLLTYFSIGIVLIASLGLFALSSYTAEKRSCEIGIRKVMGAGVNSITALLSLQFLKLILIAFMVSVIPTFLFIQKWLQGFAYHQELTFSPILVAGLFAIIISMVTVAYHTIKIAMIDPVKTLRSE